MGTCQSEHELTIKIESAETDNRKKNVFDFHASSLTVSTSRLLFPSYLNRNANQQIEFSYRSKYDTREYEIGQKIANGVSSIVLKELSIDAPKIWRVVAANNSLPVQEGQTIKLGQVQLVIRTICRNFQCTRQSIFNPLTSQMPQSRHDPIFQNKQKESTLTINMCTSRYSSKSGVSPRCRVCMRQQQDDHNPLLSLCQCSGSIKYVHYQCHKKWVASKSITKLTSACQYYQYDNTCDLCKQTIESRIVHNGQDYTIFQQTRMHPPYVILARQQHSRKYVQYVIPLREGATVQIGRNQKRGVEINNTSVSRTHCLLEYINRQLFIHNLDPTYGTYVSIQGKLEVKSSDQLVLAIGAQLLRLTIEGGGNCLALGPEYMFEVAKYSQQN